MRDSAPGWAFLLIALTTIVLSTLSRYRRLIAQWFRGLGSRNWPSVTALIDLANVTPQTEQTRSGERTVCYIATLTYFYRNPDLQVGDFTRIFNDEAAAQAWAESYKGSTVKVHIDPRDPTRSTLRKEDL